MAGSFFAAQTGIVLGRSGNLVRNCVAPLIAVATAVATIAVPR